MPCFYRAEAGSGHSDIVVQRASVCSLDPGSPLTLCSVAKGAPKVAKRALRENHRVSRPKRDRTCNRRSRLLRSRGLCLSTFDAIKGAQT